MRTLPNMSLALLLSLSPASGAGGLTFDGTDILTCGNFTFDLALDNVSMLAWFSPGFASTDVTNKTIAADNVANQGVSLRWAGGVTQFRMSVGQGGTSVVCDAFTAFTAGDVLGYYGNVANNVQNCEIFNINTGTFSAGSSFLAFALVNSAVALEVGGDGNGNPQWIGDIYTLVMTNGRIKNNNNNQLAAVRELFYLYYWPVQVATADPDYEAAYDFTFGNNGDVLGNPDMILNRNPSGVNDCTVVAGSAPVATVTTLLH